MQILHYRASFKATYPAETKNGHKAHSNYAHIIPINSSNWNDCVTSSIYNAYKHEGKYARLEALCILASKHAVLMTCFNMCICPYQGEAILTFAPYKQ